MTVRLRLGAFLNFPSRKDVFIARRLTQSLRPSYTSEFSQGDPVTSGHLGHRIGRKEPEATSQLRSSWYIPLDIFPTRCNITQLIYFWKIALRVSGGISTHHQEHIQLYLQYLVHVNRSVTYVTDRYNSHTTLRPAPALPQYRQVAVKVNKYQIL